MPNPKYNRPIKTREGCVDVYDVLLAFNVRCPAIQHAVKKLLAAGQRGDKTYEVDLREAVFSIERGIENASALASVMHQQSVFTTFDAAKKPRATDDLNAAEGRT